MTRDEFTIIERNLTRALIHGDFDLYRSIMHLPVHMVPRGGQPYELRTEEELREDFRLYHQALTIQRATDIYRHVETFSQMEEDWVEVTVETNILGSTGRIVRALSHAFVLRPQDGTWRIVLIRSSFGHIRWTRGMAKITPDGRFRRPARRGRIGDPRRAPQKKDGEPDD